MTLELLGYMATWISVFSISVVLILDLLLGRSKKAWEFYIFCFITIILLLALSKI